MEMFGNFVLIILLLCLRGINSIKISNISAYCQCTVFSEVSCTGLYFSSEEVEFEVSSTANCSGIVFKESDLYTIPRNVFRLPKSAFRFIMMDCNLKEIFNWNFEGGNHTVSMNLNRNSIKKIPSEVFKHLYSLRVLDLSFNKIESLEVNCFVGLGLLDTLSLQANSIQQIRKDTFEPLKKMRRIELFENVIEYLEDEIFAHNSELVTVGLQNNKLKIVDPKTPPALRQLADSDRVTSLAFLRLQSFISLSKNYMPYIGNTSFSALGNVRRLSLNSMNIAYVDDGALDWLQNLESLSLAGNRLERFEVNLLKHLPQLSDLDLFGNSLVYLDYQLLTEVSNVSFVSLCFNPWNCSFMAEMDDFFSSTFISTDLDYTCCINESNTEEPLEDSDSATLLPAVKEIDTANVWPTLEDDRVVSSNVSTVTLATLLSIFVVLFFTFCLSNTFRKCRPRIHRSVLP